MKRIGLTLMPILIMAFPIFSQNVEIPDTDFLYALIEEGVDINGDSLISYDEALWVVSLNVSGRNISDLSGIDAFVNIDSIDCDDNRLIRLDVSNNTSLTYLNCRLNEITSLNISNNMALEYLHCGFNQLSVPHINTTT